jgi:hypothetical protein
MGQIDEARYAYDNVIDLAPPESELSDKARERLNVLGD